MRPSPSNCLSLGSFLATALIAVKATTLSSGPVAVPLGFNAQYAPNALELLTDGILRYGLFGTSVDKYPLLGQALKSAKFDLALGKRTAEVPSRRNNVARAVHNRRLLGLKLDLGIGLSVPGSVDLDVDVDLDQRLDLASGIIFDDKWGTSTTRLSNSQKDNAVGANSRGSSTLRSDDTVQ